MIRRFMMTILAAAIAAMTAQADAAARPAATAELSVLTYNVHGLPWPVAENRRIALAEIGERLHRMRLAGRQPGVVVLQEAFTEDARRIGQTAGYRYAAYGPAANGDSPAPAWQAGFSALLTAFNGVTPWKAVDSGLVILSDYPIVETRSIAFSSRACAGYDCLANKGVLLARLALPGAPQGVMVAVTHLNSQAASGVDDHVSDAAYVRQLDVIDHFLEINRDQALPLIFAGDFNNAGPVRNALLMQHARDIWHVDGMSSIGEVLARLPLAPVAHRPLPAACHRNKDWQFRSSSAVAQITPLTFSLPFGLERGGSMLSDHFGYMESYRIDWRSGEAGQTHGVNIADAGHSPAG